MLVVLDIILTILIMKIMTNLILITFRSTNIHSHRIMKSHDQTCEWASASASRVLYNWGQILPANGKVSFRAKLREMV